MIEVSGTDCGRSGLCRFFFYDVLRAGILSVK